MFKPSYKDWPKGYHRLLHYTIILMVVSLAALWLGVFPRWRIVLGIIQHHLAQQH